MSARGLAAWLVVAVLPLVGCDGCADVPAEGEGEEGEGEGDVGEGEGEGDVGEGEGEGDVGEGEGEGDVGEGEGEGGGEGEGAGEGEGEVTFTSAVIDLIVNRTDDVSDPVPFVEFVSLNDPDLDNPDAYETLFP